jgi:hypothetical protein
MAKNFPLIFQSNGVEIFSHETNKATLYAGKNKRESLKKETEKHALDHHLCVIPQSGEKPPPNVSIVLLTIRISNSRIAFKPAAKLASCLE